MNQFIDILMDNKLLSQQLIDSRKAFKGIQDQNSQLEGQLKQMQKMITD